MAYLNKSTMAEAAKTRFRSFQLTAALPVAVVPTAPQRPMPGAPAGRIAANVRPGHVPPMSMPPALFRASESTGYGVAIQKQVNDEYSPYIDRICAAICEAHSSWKSQAYLTGVTINGAIAAGGRIEGPALNELIRQNAPSSGLFGKAQVLSAAVAAGIGDAWRDFLNSFRVPGLAWYPSFEMYPGPTAPPTQNVPSPLSGMLEVGMLSAPILKQRVIAKVQTVHFGEELVDAIATAFSGAIASWLQSQMVTGVMGIGPVPTFAPPSMPVGRVLGGSIISVPGHLAT